MQREFYFVDTKLILNCFLFIYFYRFDYVEEKFHRASNLCRMEDVRRMGYVRENEVAKGTLFHRLELNLTRNKNFNS